MIVSVVANKVGIVDMKNKLCVLLLLSCVVSCASLYDGKLSGRYVSDREATLKYLENTGTYTSEHLGRIGKLLGKMEITYNDNIAIIELDGETHQEKYKIIEISSDLIIIEYDLGNKYEITFNGDGYWISGGVMPSPYMEKFIRVE